MFSSVGLLLAAGKMCKKNFLQAASGCKQFLSQNRRFGSGFLEVFSKLVQEVKTKEQAKNFSLIISSRQLSKKKV
jgi:hypothetical protein